MDLILEKSPVWDATLDAVRLRVSSQVFDMWFKNLNVIGVNEDRRTISLRTTTHTKNWIAQIYPDLLPEALASAGFADYVLDWQVIREEESELVFETLPRERFPLGGLGEGIFGTIDSELNPKYTFEKFVVGSSNEFAHAAALGASEMPGTTYNPLFIYGGVGLGKTHLMQAIGQYVWSKKKTAKVMYLSSELFINEFIDAIQHSTLVKFRKRYRQADLLLIDDIQFLGGKERSQEEFFHTFNTLFDGHKQIVLSSDRPASEIANLEHRLVSRFEWGLTAELQPPDVETRTAILRKKARSLNIKLRDETFDFLATRIRTNVRRLEGALMRVASFASLSGKELTNEVVEHLLKDILNEEARHAITIEQIQRRVAEHFDVRIADMTSKRRPANIAFPRQIAMYLARELTKASLNEIGDAFGGRDHGTVLHACKLVKRRMVEQDNIRQTITFIDSSLQR